MRSGIRAQQGSASTADLKKLQLCFVTVTKSPAVAALTTLTQVAVEQQLPCSLTTKHDCTWCMCLAGQVAELHDCQMGAVLDKQSISPTQLG